MKFKSTGSEIKTSWLKVADVPDRDYFVIVDEIQSGRGNYEEEGQASGMIKRKNDGKAFMYTFRIYQLDALIGAFGDNSKEWIGKEISLTRGFSKKRQKNFLSLDPIFNLDEIKPKTNEVPF